MNKWIDTDQIEHDVKKGYHNVEDKVIDTVFAKEGESTQEAKNRIKMDAYELKNHSRDLAKGGVEKVKEIGEKAKDKMGL